MGGRGGGRSVVSVLDACWTLDRKDSNLQSPGPKPVALPLGHGPVLNKQEKEREGEGEGEGGVGVVK